MDVIDVTYALIRLKTAHIRRYWTLYTPFMFRVLSDWSRQSAQSALSRCISKSKKCRTGARLRWYRQRVQIQIASANKNKN